MNFPDRIKINVESEKECERQEVQHQNKKIHLQQKNNYFHEIIH